MRILLFILTIILSTPSIGQQLLYSQSFETTSGYTFPWGNGVGSSNQDFFDRTDSAGAPPQEVFTYTGFDSSYFIAAEDIDGVLNTSFGEVQINNIDISNKIALSFTASFASGTDIDIDGAGDSISVLVSIDNGNWTTIGRFEADSATYTSTSGPFNGQFAEDTNLDGNGDGTRLTGTFQDFSWNVPGTGDSLAIRVVFNLNSGDEEGAMDNIRIFGYPDTLTSLKERIPNEETILLYPNPAREEVYITAKEEMNQIDILDIKGRVVFSTNISGTRARIDVSTLGKGIYTVRTHTTKGIENLKLQVQ